MADTCRPDNAETNPLTARFLDRMGKTVREAVVASAHEKATRLAALGVAMTTAAAEVEIDEQTRSDGGGLVEDLLREIDRTDLSDEIVGDVFGKESETSEIEVAFFELRYLIVEAIVRSFKSGVPVADEELVHA